MFHALAAHLESLFAAYGWVGVFAASVAEEMVAPIPSNIIVFTAGHFLTKGLSGSAAVTALLFQVILPASAGMALGSLVPYFIARIGERVVIERFGKYLRVDWTMIERMQAWTKKSSSDEIIIFATRAIPGVPTLVVSLVAGLARIPAGEYLLCSFLGCLVRTSLIATIGWAGGKRYGAMMALVGQAQNHLSAILFAVLFSMIAAWITVRWRRAA